jgi:hypothetical protein
VKRKRAASLLRFLERSLLVLASTLEYRRGKAVITVGLRFGGGASFFSARARENRRMLLILWFPRPVPVWEQHVVATSRVQYGTG